MKISLEWIVRCWQYKHNYIDTYLHIYVLRFAQPHKNKLNYLFTFKKNKIKLVTATKSQSGWNDGSSQWKNVNCSSRMLCKRLLTRFFKVQWSPILITLHNGENKTILKNVEQQLMSVIKFKPNLCTAYIGLCKNFGRWEMILKSWTAYRNDCFHWTLIPPS